MNGQARAWVAVVAVCFGAQAFAADFGQADALYERRAEGVQVIEQARDAYRTELAAADEFETIYAVTQMSRLVYYQGLIVPETEKDIRQAFFKQCWDDVEAYLHPDAVGEIPEYPYWKGVCMASYAKEKGIASSLAQSRELVETIESGILLDDTYEGGGFYRLGAVVFQNLPTVNPFGPTLDLNRSVEYAELALNSSAYLEEVYPETATGDYFYNIYEYYALALARLEDTSAAKDILEGAITRIASGDIPLDRKPETEAIGVILQRVLAEL